MSGSVIRDEEGRVEGRSGRHAGPRRHTRGVRDLAHRAMFLPCQIGTAHSCASGSRPDRVLPFSLGSVGHPDAMRRRLAPRDVAITRVNPIVNREQARGRLVVTRGRGRGSKHDLGGD